MNVIKTDKKYASEFLTEIPVGIVDKVVCGCGMTTIAIENNLPTIIAVPNVQLIKNKQSQYPNSRSGNTIYGLYGSKHRADLLDKYVASTAVPKIMVTYDSLHKCSHLLADGWRLVIDEADQLLFLNDLKVSGGVFGADAISRVYSVIQDNMDKVSLISATHIPLKYLPDFITELPFTRIDWHDSLKSQPIAMKRGKPYSSLSSEIISPMLLHGSVNIEGVLIKKVLLFVNSLSAIMSVIADNQLPKSEVGIICSNSIVSLSKLDGYRIVEDFTNLPKYTFITSSGFQGIDLYDTEAIPVVVSCTSKQYTMLGVEHQLKQAVSRIRNSDNVHNGRYIFLYNQSIFDSTEQDLTAELDHLEAYYSKLATDLDSNSSTRSKEFLNNLCPEYKKYLTLSKDGHVVVNSKSLNADRFFVVEVRKAYVSGFDTATLFTGDNVLTHERIISTKKVTKSNYESAARQLSKIHIDPLNMEQPASVSPKVVSWYGVVMSLSNYYKLSEQVASYGKIQSNAGKAVAAIRVSSTERIRSLILNAFRVGSRYSRSDVKQSLTSIYVSNGISKAAVYTDLLNFLQYEETRSGNQRIIKIISHTK